MVWMNFGHLLLGLHNFYIHLSIFFCHFLSYFNDSMSYDVINDDMSYCIHDPCAHQVSLRYLEKWAKYHHCLTTTTAPIIIITRGTVPWGTVNPIPIRLVTGTKDKVSPGNSRWQQLAPFERASVTSYSTLMVTMDLCASVSKLQPSEICLKCAWPPFDLWRSL